MTETSYQLQPGRSKSSRLKLLIGVAVLLAVAATAYAVWQKNRTYHFAVVQEGVLYRDGLKSAAQFAATLDNVHPHTVVSLIDAKELADPQKPQFAQEEQLCITRGINLRRIPVTLGGWPNARDIDAFLAIVEDKTNRPVLIHCAQGVRRTGIFVAAYQESAMGYDRERADNAVLTFGHSGSTREQITRFITGYDPQSHAVLIDLGHGNE